MLIKILNQGQRKSHQKGAGRIIPSIHPGPGIVHVPTVRGKACNILDIGYSAPKRIVSVVR